MEELKKFSNGFKALDWCCINPMKEIIFDFNQERPFSSIIHKVRYNPNTKTFQLACRCLDCFKMQWHDSEFSTGDIFGWKNIKEYKEKIKNKMTKEIELTKKLFIFLGGLKDINIHKKATDYIYKILKTYNKEKKDFRYLLKETLIVCSSLLEEYE